MTMDDISEQLALRDRYRRKLWMLKTPEQRVEDMAKRSRATLSQSPEGYAHFLRRNFKARAIDVTKLHE
jgi:hypothetical protein